MSSATFSQRVSQACDSLEGQGVPPHGKGRQSYIAQSLGVSAEAVRKWFHDEARPKPPLMRKLAELLNVEETWLAMGVQPEMDRNQRRTHARNTDGAVLLVRGLITLAGGSCAEPSEDDPRGGYTSLYVIQRGRQTAVHVALARSGDDNTFDIDIPKEYSDVRVVAVVTHTKGAPDFLDLTSDAVHTYKVRKGGDYTLRVSRIGRAYTTQKHQWTRITDFEGFV